MPDLYDPPPADAHTSSEIAIGADDSIHVVYLEEDAMFNWLSNLTLTGQVFAGL